MSEWTFITNHGAVLAVVGKEVSITAREVALRLDITERSVLRIIKDLEDSGYILINRDGHINQYEINTDLPLRHPEARDVAVGELLHVLTDA